MPIKVQKKTAFLASARFGAPAGYSGRKTCGRCCFSNGPLLACLTLTAFVFWGCSVATFGDRVGSKFKYRYGLREPIASGELSFADDRIFMQFRIDESFVNFALRNSSTQPLRVLWDRGLLVVDGNITPINYSASVYALQPVQRRPALIMPDATLTDFLVPAQNLRLIDGTWVERDLFPTRDFGNEELRAKILENVGKTITMYLPLASGEKVIDYVFEFEVAGIDRIDWKNYRPPERKFGQIPPTVGTEDVKMTAIVVGFFIVAGVYFLFIRKPTPED
ncbi:MAG: hypothetical protein ACE5H0_08630 [Bacteroidota bacterium]